MQAELAAIRALIDALPVVAAVYDVTVPTLPTLPYVIVWDQGDTASAEVMAGDDVHALVGITHVAGTPEGVRTVRAAVRAVLDDARPVVPGRSVELHRFDARAIEIDNDVTIPNTSTHPAYGVDIYSLTSVPA